MKAYSIGRESGCDIVINDSTDVISRRHAVLNVMPSGKMTIVDQSHNGTYVNGIRISPNVPVPITRKDNISFAHVARLDWNVVPRTINPLVYIIGGVVAVLLIVGGIVGYNYWSASEPAAQPAPPAPVVTDTTSQKKTEAPDAKPDDPNKQEAESDKQKVEDAKSKTNTTKKKSNASKKDQAKTEENSKSDKTDANATENTGVGRGDR
jgi:pSer/pThr/pTyr-binding forkhead associated (FHA) protein